MKMSSSPFRTAAAWAMIVGVGFVVGGCGGETPAVKPESTSPPPAAAPAAPPAKLSAAEKAALKKKRLTEDEPSAQERRRGKLQAKTAE